MVSDRAATLPLVARAALADAGAQIVSWEQIPLGWVAIAATTGEITRYRGVTADGRTWSAILKVLRRPDGSRTHDWRREADIYASGLLERLPPGIVAPLVYRIDASDGEVSLWLEDVIETDPVWPLERYAVAARDLGRFNGAYTAGAPIPDVVALPEDWLASWVAGRAARATTILADPSVMGHELVRRVASRDTVARIGSFYARVPELITALDTLPRTLSHLDAWRANLMARDRGGTTQTVAIDWSVLGRAPVGQEIAVFVTGARVWLSLPPAEADAIGELAFSSYVGGLRDAGWSADEGQVRFAYTASAALWALAACPISLRRFALPEHRGWLERKFGMSLDDAAAPFGRFIEFALRLGDEALAALR